MSQASAEDFLSAMNSVYDDCIQGTGHLDRIIVGVPAKTANQARTFLTPILYAYWERFFRIAFSEYLRCLELEKLPLKNLHVNLAKKHISRKIKIQLETHKAPTAVELPHFCGLTETQATFSGIANWMSLPAEFPERTSYVKTHSNVGYDVLRENCQSLGVDIKRIKSIASESGHILFVHLTELVDARNDIAHGSRFEETKTVDWEQKRTFVLDLMFAVEWTLYETLLAV